MTAFSAHYDVLQQMLRSIHPHLEGEQGAGGAIRKDEVLHLLIRRVAPSFHESDLLQPWWSVGREQVLGHVIKPLCE
jgi:hypothetical protein